MADYRSGGARRPRRSDDQAARADLGRARPAGAAVSVGRAPPCRRYRRATGCARRGSTVTRGRARHFARALAGAAQRLLIGSHLDSVIDAGNYDGPLGVIAGILAVGHFAGKPPLPSHRRAGLRRRGGLALSLDAVVFGGLRRPVRGRRRSTLADRDGVTFADAIMAYGKNLADIPQPPTSATRRSAMSKRISNRGRGSRPRTSRSAWSPVIVGQSRSDARTSRRSGPRRHRADDDAARRAGRRRRSDGARRAHGARCQGQWWRPSARSRGQAAAPPTSFPATSCFIVDIRSGSDNCASAMSSSASRPRCARSPSGAQAHGPSSISTREVPTTACDAGLQDRLAAAVGDRWRAMRLPSGAGHDAHTMAKLCPIGMLFVRCRGGISHNPAEFCEPRRHGRARSRR